jgi:hypothetical protein
LKNKKRKRKKSMSSADLSSIAKNVGRKTYVWSMVGISIAASVISTLVILFFFPLLISFSKVYKNVNRKARALVRINSDRSITLLNVQDPYKVFTGATFGSGAGLNQADADGTFYINLTNSKYDFQKATIHAYLRRGFVVLDEFSSSSVKFLPYFVNRDGDTYEVLSQTDSYDMFLNIIWEQPASS